MTEEQLKQLKFPIGPFAPKEAINDAELESLVNTIEKAPAAYTSITNGLSPTDLKRTYREGSWNIQQLVNHVADMQLLHFFRMKKALTESDYKEITLVNIDGWSHTADGLTSAISDSLIMFEGINKRFLHLIRSLTEEQKSISYYHPVRKIWLDQRNAIAMNAWHVKHHLEHIRIALETRNGA